MINSKSCIPSLLTCAFDAHLTTFNVDLANLPVELLLLICGFLENRDLLRLGIAWKYFLKTYTPSFDPTNERRRRLRYECRKDKDLFPKILMARFQWFPRGFRLLKSPMPASFFAALFDFGELDWKSVVDPAPLPIVAPSFDDISRMLTCRSVLEQVGANWGRGVLELRLQWDFLAGGKFEHELLIMYMLLQKTDWISSLALSVVRLSNSKTVLHDRWRRAIAILVSALPGNETLWNIYLACRPSEKLYLSKGELLEIFRVQVGQIELMGITLPNANELGPCLRALITNNSLFRFGISNVVLRPEQVIQLAKAIRRHPSLEVLELRNVSLDDAGAIAIAKMLETNRYLNHVDVGKNPIGDRGMNALLGALKKNRSLDYFGLERDGQEDIAYVEVLREWAAENGWTTDEVIEDDFIMVNVPRPHAHVSVCLSSIVSDESEL